MDVLIRRGASADGRYLGRGPHQAPEVDGSVEVTATGGASETCCASGSPTPTGWDLTAVPAAAGARLPGDAAPAPGVLAAGTALSEAGPGSSGNGGVGRRRAVAAPRLLNVANALTVARLLLVPVCCSGFLASGGTGYRYLSRSRRSGWPR